MSLKWSDLENRYPEIQKKIEEMQGERFSSRLWDKDPNLWRSEPEHQKVIKNRMGWLAAPNWSKNHIAELEDTGREIVDAGFTNIVLMGMGGSSLCPEVFHITFGSAAGYPALHVLDTTDADTICEIESKINLENALFIVASKSGGTIEVMSFYKYFHQKLVDIKGEKAGGNFIAITDPGSSLEELGKKNNFRKVFLNPADIGGRFSALSYFGLVPAALIGMDLSRLTQSAAVMAQACGPGAPQNPGLQLGAILGEMAKFGRDKLTLILSEPVASFGYWAEQLIAESTGKEGTGILPVEGEPIGKPEVYDNDRLFVAITLKDDSSQEDAMAELDAAGHPIVRIELENVYDLGGQFFLWEVATSVAGAVLGINPFDEPNVTESKNNTAHILDKYRYTGSLPDEEAVADEGDIKLYATTVYCGKLISSPPTLSSVLQAHLANVRPGDYLALTAYIQATPAIRKILGDIREDLRNRLKVATTIGYGPRFLHSTGQLHKGGADNGVFIQITSEGPSDLAIPGEPYSFNVLKAAQAMGDFQSLAARGRRLVRVHLSGELDRSLESLKQLIISL